MDYDKAGKQILLQLDEMDEWRLKAYESCEMYKQKMKYNHDKKIIKREFKPGQQVLVYNTKLNLFPRKLKSI